MALNLAGSTGSRLTVRPAPLPRPDEDEPGTRWRAVVASSLLHGAVLLGLAVLALLEARAPDAPILVELVDAGAAGLAGGSNGGGGTGLSSAAPTPGRELVEAMAAPAPPPSAPVPAPDPLPQPAPVPAPAELAELSAETPVEAVAEETDDPLLPPPPPQRPALKPAPPQPAAQPAPTPPSAAQDPAARPSQAPAAAQVAKAPAAETVSARAPALERSPEARQAAGPGTGAPGAAANTGATGTEGTGRGLSGSGKAAVAGSGFGAGDDYLKRLRRWIKQRMEYPAESKRRKEEGTVLVAFTIARDGTILSKEIRESSGFPGLDEAVLDMLDRSSPVPPLPEEFVGEQARVVLPFQFELSLINRMF